MARSQEDHPEVCITPRSAEEACLQLIHQKAYDTAAERARGLRVLDLGCNNGYGTRVLATQAASVVGVDVSADLVETARRGHVPDNVSFRRVDGRMLPFADGSFDLVTSFQVIEHIPETGPFLEEVIRVLVPGGGALFTTPNANIRLDPGIPPWNPFHVREYRPEELRACLAPFFDQVEVLGLYGSEQIESVERARVAHLRARARKNARLRWRLYRGVRHRAGLLLPPELRQRLRDLLRRRRRGGTPVPSGLAVDELYYRSEAIEDALDLLAVCRLRGTPA